MIKLNLKTSNKAQEQIKQYLEENVSQILADKINNGVKITKDNKTLLNKKDLDGFWKFATDEARKQAEKGSNGAYVDNETVFGWAIHYFEEDTIEGKLFNEDGTEIIKETPKQLTKIETKPKKPENAQATLFDMMQEDVQQKEKPITLSNEEKQILKDVFDEDCNDEEENETDNIVQEQDYKVNTVTGEIIENTTKTFDKETAIILASMLDGKIIMK